MDWEPNSQNPQSSRNEYLMKTSKCKDGGTSFG